MKCQELVASRRDMGVGLSRGRRSSLTVWKQCSNVATVDGLCKRHADRVARIAAVNAYRKAAR